MDTKGFIRRIVCKPNKAKLRFVWAAAVWQPEFTHFMNEYLSNLNTSELQAEMQIGHIVQFFMEAGYLAAGVEVSQNPPMDVGNARRLKSLWTFST
jgi:hypothetical protein